MGAVGDGIQAETHHTTTHPECQPFHYSVPGAGFSEWLSSGYPGYPSASAPIAVLNDRIERDEARRLPVSYPYKIGQELVFLGLVSGEPTPALVSRRR